MGPELTPPAPPPGFELMAVALERFLDERVRATDKTGCDHERTQAEIFVTKALMSGAVVVFVQARGAEPKRIRPHFWTVPENVQRLYSFGASWHRPLVLTEEFFRAEGIALVDKTNFANFSSFAGHWPPFPIPPVVRLMLDVLNDWAEMDKDAPIQKADVINLFRQHWPPELEVMWPSERRTTHWPETSKDGCPEKVSMLAQVLVWPRTWSGRAPRTDHRAAFKTRRDRRDPRPRSRATPEAPKIEPIGDD